MAEVVIYEWKLKRPCGNMRPFCRTCTNTFAIDTCNPDVDCKTPPPSIICLKPGVPEAVECGNCKDGVAPGAFMAFFTLAKFGFVDPVEIGPYLIIMGKGSFNHPSGESYTGSCYASIDVTVPTEVCTSEMYPELQLYAELSLNAEFTPDFPSGVVWLAVSGSITQPYGIDQDTQIGDGCFQTLTSEYAGIASSSLCDYVYIKFRLEPYSELPSEDTP